MIELRDIHSLRIGTADLAAAKTFATEILGLQVVEDNSEALYLRSDNRHHSLCYVKGKAGDHIVAFELKDHRSLKASIGALAAADIPCGLGTEAEASARFCHSFGWFNDPSGNRIELLCRPFEANRRYFPSRDAGVKGFGHIGLNSTDIPRDEVFWLQYFNMRVSDWIGGAPLMRVNPRHHQIALFPADKPGVQHINHQVESFDDLMRSFYFLKKQGVRVVFGPGRHATSGGYFLYFEGHDGLTYEYSTSDRNIIEDEKNYRPRQFAMEDKSFCVFGSDNEISAFKD